MEDERTAEVLRHVLRQIERDRNELSGLPPSLGWAERVRSTAGVFVPRVVGAAARLLLHVESSLNSPASVRAIWREAKERIEDARLVKDLDAALEQEERLLSVITGDTVSKLIADFLCEQHPDLSQNNRSTYPDLFFSTADYSPLPKRRRGLATGPALRGGRPTSIPDGIEIKPNRGGRIRVDSHHDHQGLHLALTFDYEGGRWRAHDLCLAYLAKADYTRAERNTTATTEKFSFGHAPFISVLTGRVEIAALEEVT